MKKNELTIFNALITLELITIVDYCSGNSCRSFLQSRVNKNYCTITFLLISYRDCADRVSIKPNKNAISVMHRSSTTPEMNEIERLTAEYVK